MVIIKNPERELDPIKYLMQRKFGNQSIGNIYKSKIPTYLALDENARNLINYQKQELYCAELNRKSDEEIYKMVQEEKQKEIVEGKTFKNDFFFDHPKAMADFKFWAKMPTWTKEEAVALSLGRNPYIVNISSLEAEFYDNPFSKDHEFCREYFKRINLLTRYNKTSQLSYEPTPLAFTLWAKENDIFIPIELEKAVNDRWGEHTDWKLKFRDLEIENKNLKSSLEATQRNLIEEKNQQDINPKRKTSFDILVLVMALKKYRHDPKAKQNSSTKNIHDDILSYGLTIDQNTIREILDEAYKQLISKITLEKDKN